MCVSNYSPAGARIAATTSMVSAIRTQTVTVIFADIWGFTRASSTLPGPEIMALLREFLSLV